MKRKIFCFDLDGTICITKGKRYSRSKPIKEAIILINKLYSEGHVIKIFTSRYMGRNNDNINKAYKQGYKFTHKQLKSWGLKFHKLHMGKPSFDFLVDDKSIGFKKNWHSYLRKILKKNDYRF